MEQRSQMFHNLSSAAGDKAEAAKEKVEKLREEYEFDPPEVSSVSSGSSTSNFHYAWMLVLCICDILLSIILINSCFCVSNIILSSSYKQKQHSYLNLIITIQEKPFTLEVPPAMMTPKRKAENDAAKDAAAASASKKTRKTSTPKKAATPKKETTPETDLDDEIESEEE